MVTVSAVGGQMRGLVALALGLPGLLDGCAERPERVWLAKKGKVYCYRTLAEPDCYALAAVGR
jgi:hypothetical protein